MSKRTKMMLYIGLLFAAVLFLYLQNNLLMISRWTVHAKNLPDNFDGYKILQLSDLHSKEFGKHQKNLVTRITSEAPDIIVITGDLIDSSHYMEETCINLCEQIIQIAPVYFVAGNHEAWSNQFDGFEKRLISVGVRVLRNESERIEIDGEFITVIGMDDPDFQETISWADAFESVTTRTETEFTILLSHRPERMSWYTDKAIDLVFSGHAHGGQIRLPFIGGVIAPDQGWFPLYSGGLYQSGQTTMLVSRGLGNSIIPQRLFNLPELVVVNLVSSN